MTAAAPPPLPVFSLLCHSDVERALTCFASLHARCKDPIRHTVIDDGTLTAEDRDRLLGRFDGLTIPTREERDDLVAPLLGGRPNSSKYRTEHAFALKLIDPPLLAGGAFALCDADVLFVRDFAGLDRRPEPGQDLVFMKDWTSGYSIPFRKRALGPDRMPFPQKLNAGLLYVAAGTFDPDFVEWFLGREDFRADLFLLEQTMWAALGGRKRPFYFAPDQVAFPTIEARFPRRLVALHFIRILRDLLDDPAYVSGAEQAGAADGGRVARLDASPARIDTLVAGTITRLVRLVRPDRPPWATSAPAPAAEGEPPGRSGGVRR